MHNEQISPTNDCMSENQSRQSSLSLDFVFELLSKNSMSDRNWTLSYNNGDIFSCGPELPIKTYDCAIVTPLNEEMRF